MVFLIVLLFTSAPLGFSQNLPEWYIPLREAVYEQVLPADAIFPLYQNISGRVKTSFSGYDQSILLSRCEYMMGRAYLDAERKTEASVCFESGMSFARRALDARETDEAWVMLAENLSQNIAARSTNTFYVMGNGLKVSEYAEKALSLNPRNAAAQYMIAARWVFAPSPFNNIRRGIEMMTAIQTNAEMGKDDTFNVYSALGYAYIEQRKSARNRAAIEEAGNQARVWLNRSLNIYPTNKFVQSLLAQL